MQSTSTSLLQDRDRAIRELERVLAEGRLRPDKLSGRAAELRAMAAETDEVVMREAWLDAAERYDAAAAKARGG